MCLGFIVRMFFVKHIAIGFLGMNSAFGGLIAIFSLAELGFDAAISYVLYKKLAEKDEKTVAALVTHLKKIYIIVGLVITFAGLVVLPFLQFIIVEYKTLGISLIDLGLYYLIFLFVAVLPYFVSYKRSLIIADQKKYILNIVLIITSIISKATQIILIIIFKDFLIYIIVNLVTAIIENILINIIVTKKYPYIKTYANESITNDIKKSLYKNSGALFIRRLAFAFISGATPLFIVNIVGIKDVGLYSNYLLLFTSALNIIAFFSAPMCATFGNFAATKDKYSQIKMYKTIFYVNFFITNIIFVGLLLLTNDFVALWLGDDMLLNKNVSILMSIEVYLFCICAMFSLAYDVYGLFKHAFYRPLIDFVVFVGLAIPGALYFGISGVLFAKVITIFLIQIPFEISIVSRHGFGEKFNLLFALVVKYIVITVVAACVACLAIHFIPLTGLVGFLVKGIIISCVSIAVFILLTFRTHEFIFLKNKLLKIAFHAKQSKTEEVHG